MPFVRIVVGPSSLSIALRSSADSSVPPLGSQKSSRLPKASRSSSVASASTCLRFAADGFAESIETWSLPFDASSSAGLNGCASAISASSRRRPREHAHVVAERALERLLDLRGHVARGLEHHVAARPERGHLLGAGVLEDLAQLGARHAAVAPEVDRPQERRVPHATIVSKRWSSVAAGSPVSPVCTSEGWITVEDGRREPAEAVGRGQLGQRAALLGAGRHEVERGEPRADRLGVAAGCERREPRVVEPHPQAEEVVVLARVHDHADVDRLAALHARHHPQDRRS